MSAQALITSLPWHEKASERRMTLGLPQALMVIGRIGDGLERLCLHLAEREVARDDPIAHKMVETSNHPDLHVIRLGESTTGKKRQHIVIDQIREMIEATSLTPVRAHVRVAVIVPACHMNISAANALLKNLEEPNDSLKFILGCEHPSWLPITVRSRCQRMLAPRPTTAESLEWLEKAGVQDAAEALALANGAPLLAAESLDLLEQRKMLAEILTGEKRLSGQSHKLDSLPLDNWLPWAIDWAARGARLSMGLDTTKEKNCVDVSNKINERFPEPIEWLNLYSDLVELMRISHHPVNKRLMLEQVAYRFFMLGGRAG